MVRKASRPGYEFSGMWALPGGRIRGEAPLSSAMADTVRHRLQAEAGVALEGATAPLPGPPPVSTNGSV